MKTKVKKCKVCGCDPAYYSTEAGYDLCTKHQTRLIKKKISAKKAALLLLATACIILYFASS
jgi:hypothetical protein